MQIRTIQKVFISPVSPSVIRSVTLESAFGPIRFRIAATRERMIDRLIHA